MNKGQDKERNQEGAGSGLIGNKVHDGYGTKERKERNKQGKHKFPRSRILP